MNYLIFKYAVTAGLVVLISEAAKLSDKLGALISSLPLVTILTLLWLHLEQQPNAKLANHAAYTFWYVIPTLPMFLAFPWMISRWSFWASLLAGIGMTCILFLGFALLVRHLGINLLP